MWLIYLRFDDNGEVMTYHITAPTRKIVDSVLALAEQHGLTKLAKLAEYAYFYSRGTMKPKHVPNFHFYTATEFTERWEKAK